MNPLFPAIKPYAEHQLKVDDTHTLHIEECGNPDGEPILILHSGPGAGIEGYHRQFCCPERYRMILYDQRGCGRSTPHAELKDNTTPHLIDDIEAIRAYFQLSKWRLFGGAWGSALALLYACQHPQYVLGLVLHRVFLARQRDIDWFYKEGANQFFPDHWQDFKNFIPQAEQSDLVKAYHQRLTGQDELAKMGAAKQWSLWQAKCSSLQPHTDIIEHFVDPHFALRLACIESHYFLNRCFIADNELMQKLSMIRHIPTFIIHGRYDIVSPLACAFALHEKLPASELIVVRDAGHSVKEPGIIDAIILATQQILNATPDVC